MVDVTAIRDSIRRFLAARCHIPIADLDGDTQFEEDLGLDSFDLVALLIEVEDAYGVVITDSDAGDLSTIDDAADLIASRAAE